MDTSHDPRSQYLGNIAAHTIGHGELAGQIAAAPEITAFLNGLNYTLLQIRADKSGLRFHLDQIAEPPAGGKEVHFVKLDKNEPIEMANIQSQVIVSSIKQNAINSLYVLINKIYVPLLRQGDDDVSAEAGNKEGHALRDPLYSLRAGLRRTIRKGGTNLKKFDFDPEQFRGILEPLDEIETWQDLENANDVTRENEKLRRTAEIISRHLAPLLKPFQDLPQAPLGSIVGYIDSIEDSLSSIWTDPDIFPVYPEARMENTFRVISKAFGSRIEREFKESDVWQASFSDVRLKLNECMRICAKWKDTVTHLTKISWKQKSKGGHEHQWKASAYVDRYLENIIIRMTEIFELRSQHDELLRLLTSEERQEMKVEGFFAPFRKINSFYTNEILVDTWKNARRQYERMLEPVEKEICQKLRKEVFTEQASTPTQRMREVQRWKGLMSKPSIQKECAQERENLVTEMIAEVKKMADDFAARTGQGIKSIPGMEKPPQCQNVSPVISAIIWARQLSQKIDSNIMAAGSLFKDLPTLKKLETVADSLRQDIRQYETGLFQEWQGNILAVLKDPNQEKKYQMTGQLMEFDFETVGNSEGGLLKVNYSEKLVTLVKDARAIGEHGFPIDKSIVDIVRQAKKFYKEGVALKQIANFYNSMGTQMINCQKPMMLQKATRFEQVIRNPVQKNNLSKSDKIVTWEDPAQIERYTDEVQTMATELINENRKLRKVHINVINEIIELMNIDLLKSEQVWTEKMNQIKLMVDQETMGRPADGCRRWLTHINYQLYKALEFQYRMGLESLNENLPEITADLVYRNQKMEFRPAFEALKQKYFGEIQRFITTPLRFPGVGGGGKATEIFLKMPESNAKFIPIVYQKAEELFDQVRNVETEYVEWTALSHLDIQSHIEENFKGVDDWETNFQMLQQKRIELKKLPDSKKIDCITINIVPFKGGIEEVFKKLSDALVTTLADSIDKDAEQVRQFVQGAQAQLGSNPTSVDEIEAMHKAAMDIEGNKQHYVELFAGLQKKNHMIKQIQGQGRALQELESKWREFDARLGAFNDKIEDQKKRLREEIDKRAKSLAAELEKMYDRWQEKKPKERNQLSYEEAMETSEVMKDMKQHWSELEAKIEKLYVDAKHFGKAQPQFQYYDMMKGELNEAQATWSLFDAFKTELDGLNKEEWLTFRKKGYFEFQDLFLKWQEALKVQEKGNVVVRFLLQQIETFKQAWPLIKLCTGESFEKEHWKRLFTILKLSKDASLDKLKFGDLVESIPVMIKKAKEIKELSDKAQGEVTIREAIHELRAWCDNTEFILTEHESNGRQTHLIKEWKEVMTQVSDHQSLILSLKESRFYSGFADQIEQIDKKLGGIDDYLAKLNIIQRKWVYLEPIFMRGALPQEQGRFMRVDEDFRNIANGIGSDPKVVSLCDVPGIKETLETILSQLDMCQKALNSYLEEKRQKFSRFYFIGDDDLLEILGQAKNPVVIQTHLKKLFAGIFKVELADNNTKIKSMISSAGEYVPLLTPVEITEEVEDWLGSLEKEMRATLDDLLKKSLKSKGLDLVNSPSQVCCLSEMIAFSDSCAQAIKKGKLANYKQDLMKQLEGYTSFDNKGDNLLFSKVKSLILDILHNIDVVDQLTQDQSIIASQNPNDWMWYKQLKYHIDQRSQLAEKDKPTKVGMCDAFFDYTFEYQGNAPKLVHSPLTDKCYLTLVLGMKMGFGGNPYGPAGTGKTESVKALGQAFGRQVLVFNCDEGLDYKAMGRIFIGLVKCGAWGCFDEFNRLLEEQLSAISQQIQVIQWAIKEQAPALELLGRNIPVNKNAGIFVTMNPAGKGYGGRSKLPDNLKQLFRPVAMSAPDVELIAETLLFSEGFKHAKKLSAKIVSLFRLGKQLLSKQQHYDWGLRALKTILNTGGQLIQAEIKKGIKLTYEAEALLLIKSIRVNTISKLTYTDSRKYEFLQADMFPGIKSEDIAYEKLNEAIKEAIKDLKLQYIEKQVQKILQFYEATRQRMGVILVGPSGCGKTTIWKVLKLALEKMKQSIVTHVMNPKSMPRQQLLGLMNHDTREFQDGVLTASARLVVKEPLETNCWIVNDGDIDPEWVESLNSVLDDNHLLTLPNGERINFGDNINFIFETHEMRYASPATVSRLGMIFLSEEDVDIGRITMTWLQKQDEKLRNSLAGWLEDIFLKSLSWVLQRQELYVVETTKVGIVNNALSYMSQVSSKGHFACACIQGLGGNFTLDVRAQLAQFVLNLAGERPADPKNLLLNYFEARTGTWAAFAPESTGETKLDDLKNQDLPPIVKTIGIQRDIAMIKPWLENGDSFIVVGPEGCGKNLMIRNQIKLMKSTQIAIIHCNAQTSAFHVIQKLNQMCSQSTGSSGKVYRPRDCSRLIIYLKDINLPKPDKYNTIQLIAFLQQIVCYKGFYDDHLEFVSLERIQIVASMNPSSTIGRHRISTRFTANVRICYMEYPTNEELVPVYAEFLKTILSNPTFAKGQMANSSKKLAQFLIDLYSNVREKFSVDDHRHYLFTPRDLTGLVFNLLRYEINEAQGLIETLIYESSRIFRDRLVDKDSKIRFDKILYSLLKNHLRYNEQMKATYFISKIAQGSQGLVPGLPLLGRIGAKDFEAMIDQTLRAYEREYKAMDVHLIEEILDLVAYTERTLSQPGANLLLAGRSGTGRKQSAQLVAHLLNMEFFTPSISRDYSMKEFKRDLKEVLLKAGVEATRTCLFIEDHQLLQDEFLEYLNSLISAGEVPGLYSPEELEPVLAQLKDEMSSQYEYKTTFELFVSRIKKNLSIVMSLDYSHPKFVQNCASNPALFSQCNVIWCEGWTKEALHTVARNELADISSEIGKAFDQVIASILILHNSSQSLGASPLAFMNLIHLFKQIHNKIVQTSGGQSKHLLAGLDKLEEARTTVDVLSREAGEQKILLKQKKAEASAALVEITKSMEQKAERKQEVEALQAKCAEDQQLIEARKASVESELSHVQPQVDAARAAVGDLKPANLNEIKGFRMPPDAVSDVLQGVLRLMGQEDTSWNAMKRFLSQAGVIQGILNFDASQVTNSMRNKVNKLIQSKPLSFEQANINNVSRACAPLAAWVKANVMYSEVLLKIEPLTAELNGLMSKLQKFQQRVDECRAQLQELEIATEQLNQNFAQKTQDAGLLEARLMQAEATLEAAQKLLQQLGGENERWRSQVATLQREMALVPIKSLLASAYITYLGGENETSRESHLTNWCSGLRVEAFNIRTFLATEAQLLTFKKEGLPADDLSMENAIMILNSVRTPLIIDPATQATEWLKRSLMQSKESVEILNHQEKKFNTTLELAIRFGKVLVIQEVDGIESLLFPVLRQDLIQQGPRQVVQIGDKVVDYNPAFMLYLTTRDQFVEISPNCQALVTNVNFTVTKSGLEGQLLSITINFEQPELESRKTQLLEEEERLQIQLAGYEKRLLEELANSEGNILANKTLIDSLNQTKLQSSQIEKALTESKNLQQSLDQQRNVYKNFAHIGSNLFMVFGDLIKMNNMYQFSLASFVRLFTRSLETKPQASSTEEKLTYLSNSLIKLCFSEIGRSLFKSDRLTYSLHFVKGIYPNLFGKSEWEFFSGSVLGAESQAPAPRWLPKERAEAFLSFAGSFPALISQLQFDNESVWAPLMQSPEPEKSFPQQLAQRISSFQRCTIIKVLRPDRLESAMQYFVFEAFGGQSIQPAPFALRNLYENESNCKEPILFIISPGSDPSTELQEFAETVVGRQSFHELAMGGGQNETAIELVKNAAKKGEWVCLKNLHLVTSWLPSLEKEIKMLNPDKKFRLWLTSEPHGRFPSILLQSSLKITYETPPGMKNNLMRTFSYVTPSQEQQQQNPVMTQLLFVLSWFHALIQERRKYIPQGWSKYYEFSFGDLKAGELILTDVQAESKGGAAPWQKIFGILENAIYGGRIDNPYDLRVLRAYIQQLFNDSTLKGQEALSGMIAVPQSGHAREFLGVIHKVPDYDVPSQFGLPANIDRSVQRFNSAAVLASLKQLAAVSAEELRFDKQVWTAKLGPICQLWTTLYKKELFEKLQISQDHLNAADPVDAFVYMELDNVKEILQVVNESMSSIAKILKGSEMLTAKSQKEATNLLQAEIPASWDAKWEGPTNPSQWIKVVNRKANALLHWMQRAEQRTLLAEPINLSHLFHPETFLNALRQKSARQLKIAIDDLKLVSSFERNKLSGATVVQLEGLWLQGCEFDGKQLVDIRDEAGSELVAVPACHVGWIGHGDAGPYPESATVDTPVYLALDREAMLCTLQIPNQGATSTRVLAGVALFLNGSDL